MMSLPTFHTKAMYIIIHNEKDPNIKTVKDMIDMGWMNKVGDSIDELKGLIDLKSKTSGRHKIQSAGRHRITN